MASARVPADPDHLPPTGRPAAARQDRPDPANQTRPEATSVSSSPRVQRQARTIERLFGPQPGPVLQRSIHHHTVEAGWKIVESGTAGTHQPGDPAQGVYFNDLTGHYGATANDVRAGLADRLMHVGSLPELDEDLALQWGPLAVRLGVYTEKALGKVKEKDVGKKDGDRMINVGSLYMVDLDRPDLDETVARSRMPMEDIVACAAFVRGLMRANGQLDHIRRAPWWQEGGLKVRVDMNYYHNRPLDKTSRNVGMHKDTAGDNIFVNLVFTNTAATPATEWTQDRAAIIGRKKEKMLAKGVPESLLDEFHQAKALLSGLQAPGKDRIEGGVMPAMAFVSWVDELAWHATPSLLNRLKVTKDMLPQVKTWFQSPGEVSAAKNGPTLFINVLGLLHGQAPALFDGTGFLEWQFSDKGDEVQQWYESHFKVDARAKLLEQWVAVLEAEQAKRAGLVGNSLDSELEDFVEDEKDDSSSEEEEEALYQPTGISGRPRSNSDAETQATVTEAAEQQGLRSFIRTWVRIEPTG
ncbi:hypothetical protein [Roseateles sp.]|uniref:hypothetical protein n=1 Tax=Roseateles sp. TaxID=1971397 RepID=UPI002F422FAD